MQERDALHPAVAWSAFVLYLAITIVIALHHEPWRDEADPWLVARDADAITFVRRASLSGTPALWHLILVPLARSGAPYGSQKALHLAIAAASVALILFRSPFPRVTKIAAAFSYFLAYEYAIVVRSYALSVLLLLLIAAAYRTRFTRPFRYAVLVALLANTNTHSLFVAALLGLLFVYESRLAQWRAAAVMLIGGLAAVAQLAIAQGERATTFVRIQPAAPLQALGGAFLPMVPTVVPQIVAFAIVVAATVWLRRKPLLLVLLWTWYAELALIFVFWWIGGIRHAGLLLVLLLVVIWIAMRDDVERDVARTVCIALLTIALFISDAVALITFRADYLWAYSGAQEMAEFLHRSGIAENDISAHSETTTSAVAPYLDHPLWYAGIGEYGTFNMWDRKFDAGLDVPYPIAVRRARQHAAGNPKPLLLLNVEVPDPAHEGLTLVYQTQRPQFDHGDERFWLYRFR